MASTLESLHDLHDLILSGVPGVAKNDPNAIEYLSHLTTLPLSDLTTEPTKLSSDAAVLTSSLSTLCLNEYDTFLSLGNTSSTIDHSLAAFDQGVSSLLDLIPGLEQAMQEFQLEGRKIKEERKEASLVMEQQEKLLDILELPQLVDTCVRNGYHQEALDLLSHTRKLAAMHQNVGYIQQVAKEVEQAIQLMAAQLFNSLRGNVKLSGVFKAVNFLRRLKVLREEELALAFLCLRLEFLEDQLAYVLTDQEDTARCLKRYIDVWREGSNDIDMQYRTLFLKGPVTGNGEKLTELLAALLHRLLSGLFAVLEDKLKLVTEANTMVSLMTQLSFCSASMGKIGMDFRPLLVPVFERAVVEVTRKGVMAATEEFGRVMDEGGKEGGSPSKVFVIAEGRLDAHVAETPFTAHSPPAGIAALGPLAGYLNGMIITMNNLRLMAPMGVMESVVGLFDMSLAMCIEALLRYVEGWDRDGRGGEEEDEKEEERKRERENGRIIVQAMVGSVVPFVRESVVAGVFGGSGGASRGDARLEAATTAASGWIGVGRGTKE